MSKADRLTLEKKKKEIYSDFLTNFDKNPFTGYLGKVTNEESVKQSLKNLFLTNKGERFYDFQKGSRLRAALFENQNFGNFEAIKFDLIQLAKRYEPRAILNEVDISESDEDYNTIIVKIVFSIINIPNQTFNLELFIERVR